jgi:hypothetical protein
MFAEQGRSVVGWLVGCAHEPDSASRLRGRAMNMKMLAEYLEHAIGFERMADETEDGPLKEQFQKQAEAYRKLAEKQAIQIGFRKPPPQLPQSHPSS